MKILFTSILCVFIYCSGCSQSFTTGSKIEVEFGGSWHKGTVLGVKGDEYNVRYQGEGESFDVMVPKNRVRAVGGGRTGKPAKGYEAGTKVQAKLGGSMAAATIIDFEDGKYKVNFDGYGNAYDDWFSAEELQRVDKAISKNAAKASIGKPVSRNTTNTNTNSTPTTTAPSPTVNVSRPALINVWKYDKVTTRNATDIPSGATLNLEQNGDYLLKHGPGQGFDRGKWQLAGNKLSLINEAGNGTTRYKVSFKNGSEVLVLEDNIGGRIEAITYEAYNRQRGQ